MHPWPISDSSDLERLGEVLRSGVWGSGGTVQREFEHKFAEFQGGEDGVTVTNGTVTLVLCLRALGIRPGDEVIVPGITWIATALACIETNAVPVFADVDPETLCIDPKAVEALITPRTVGIIPVHLYRAMADMDALGALASKRGLWMIEDCAHAHGGRWRDRGAGTLGDLGSFSFQSSKPMTAGEGGIVLGRRELLDKVYSQRDCGRHSPQRGTRIFGGNQRMTEWQAAVLLGQLARMGDQMARREVAIKRLRELCSSLPGVTMMRDQEQMTRPICYRVVFHYDRAAAGGVPLANFVEAVRAEGIPIEMTYPAVYENYLYSTDAMTWGTTPSLNIQRCPVAEAISTERAFTLPHQILLGSDEDLQDVAKALAKVLENKREAASFASRAKSDIKSIIRRFR